MKVDGKLEVTKTQSLHCTITYQDLLALVKQSVFIPPGVNVRIFVEVPGGEDWSNTDLEIQDHPVHVTATWEVPDAPNEQG